MIACEEPLIFLENQAVHLPSPLNRYSNNICYDKDTPIVATSQSEITYVGKYNSLDPVENEMMSFRWKTFKFYKKIAESDQVGLTLSPKCFAKLLIEGNE